MQAWWQIASSSSVVTPGATAAPVRASTSAAARPATRMRSITSGGVTGETGWRTTSPDSASGGRGISGGTGRIGLWRPGRMLVVAVLWQRLNFLTPPPHTGAVALRNYGLLGGTVIPLGL